MKSNLFFVGFGVLCIFFCIHSTNGRNIRFSEAKFKRQVEPLPEPKAEVSDVQPQEKEDQNKSGDNISEIGETKKNAGEIEEPQKRNDDTEASPVPEPRAEEPKPVPEPRAEEPVEQPEERKPLEEAQASAHVFMGAPAPAQIAKKEVAHVIAQASNKEEVIVNHPAEEREEEKELAELKPAASSIIAATVNAPAPHQVEHKSYRTSYWSRSAE